MYAAVWVRPADPAGYFDLDDFTIRGFDIVISCVALIVAAPLMLIVAIAVSLIDRGPAVFAHRRIGRDGRSFLCLKFRSMAIDAQQRLDDLLATDAGAKSEWDASQKLRDDPRVTPLGDFLRRSSLDELPQLFNVLKGEMSLVGPRPIVDAEAERYGARLSDYCALRPGITGLWQISGRSDVGYRRRVAMDVLYARRRNPWLYGWILLATVPAVLTRRGAR